MARQYQYGTNRPQAYGDLNPTGVMPSDPGGVARGMGYAPYTLSGWPIDMILRGTAALSGRSELQQGADMLSGLVGSKRNLSQAVLSGDVERPKNTPQEQLGTFLGEAGLDVMTGLGLPKLAAKAERLPGKIYAQPRQGVHYSPLPREILSPEYAGSGPVSGAERGRSALGAPDSVHLGGPDYRPEQGLGNEVAHGRVRVFDPESGYGKQFIDQFNQRQTNKAKDAVKGKGYAAHRDKIEDLNALENELIGSGFKAYSVKTPAGEVIKSFDPVKIDWRGKVNRDLIDPRTMEVDPERVAKYAASKPGGFTVNPRTGEVPTSGRVISRPGSEAQLKDPSAEDFLAYMKENEPPPGGMMGGWLDNGTMYLDNSDVSVPGLGARLKTERNYQRGAYDVESGKTVPGIVRPFVEDRLRPFMADERGEARLDLGFGSSAYADQSPGLGKSVSLPTDTLGLMKPQEDLLARIRGSRTTPSGLPSYLNEEIRSLSAVPAVPQSSLPRFNPPKGNPQSIDRLYSAPNIHRVEGLVGEGQRMGGDAWYNTMPLREAYVDELGELEGAIRHGEFIDRVAATSPRSRVEGNIRRASYYQTQNQQGLPMDLSGAQPPTPYGHLAHKTQLKVLEPLQAEGAIPLDKPKTASFAENLKGNYSPLTADAHYARGIDLRKASGKPETAAPSSTQYRGAEEFGRDIAQEMGMTPAQMQANLWMGAGKQTGVANPQIFMAAFNNVLAKTAKERGIPQSQALKDFITGKLPFLSVMGATVTGEMLQDERPDI